MKALFISLVVMGFSTFTFASEQVSSNQQGEVLKLSFTDLAQKISENIVHPRPPFSIKNRPELKHLFSEATFTMSDILETLQNQNSNPDLSQLLEQINTARDQFTIINEQVSNSFTTEEPIKTLEKMLALQNEVAKTIKAPRTECRSLGFLYGYEQVCRSQF